MPLHTLVEAKRHKGSLTLRCRCGAEFSSTDRVIATEAFREHKADPALPADSGGQD